MTDLPQDSQQTRPRWRRIGAATAWGVAKLVAWFGLGFAAMAAADTAPSGSWAAATLFVVVLGAGGYVLWRLPQIIRAVQSGRTPKRHRRHQSTDSQVHNLSSWGLGKGLIRRFRRG